MSISLPNFTKNTLMILFFLIVVSCNEKVDKNGIYSIDRFEKQFYNSKPIELNELKKKYPYFFPKSFPESVWAERLNDPIQQEIFNEIQKEYESVKFLELELSSFFNKNLEINKNFIKPKVITVNTDIDYRNKIILADSILLIGLDNYLGFNHRFYEGIPFYIKEDFTALNIMSDIAEQYGIKIVPRIEYYTFLDKIIYFGKILYYKDFILNIEDRFKIGYSEDKMKWAKENEYFVWTYFIENNILFNPDNNLINRFIDDAPFSKFYLEIDNESSEMIGKYIGWQIVKSYMSNNDISLMQLMKKSPSDIYNNSKYKPKK
jgi:hypothetical protein